MSAETAGSRARPATQMQRMVALLLEGTMQHSLRGPAELYPPGCATCEPLPALHRGSLKTSSVKEPKVRWIWAVQSNPLSAASGHPWVPQWLVLRLHRSLPASWHAQKSLNFDGAEQLHAGFLPVPHWKGTSGCDAMWHLHMVQSNL